MILPFLLFIPALFFPLLICYDSFILPYPLSVCTDPVLLQVSLKFLLILITASNTVSVMMRTQEHLLGWCTVDFKIKVMQCNVCGFCCHESPVHPPAIRICHVWNILAAFQDRFLFLFYSFRMFGYAVREVWTPISSGLCTACPSRVSAGSLGGNVLCCVVDSASSGEGKPRLSLVVSIKLTLYPEKSPSLPVLVEYHTACSKLNPFQHANFLKAVSFHPGECNDYTLILADIP